MSNKKKIAFFILNNLIDKKRKIWGFAKKGRWICSKKRDNSVNYSAFTTNSSKEIAEYSVTLFRYPKLFFVYNPLFFCVNGKIIFL